MAPIVLRLDKYLKHLKMKPGELASQLGYDKPEKINRLFRDGNAMPSVEILYDIANKFVELDIHWLITGKGTMLHGAAETAKGKQKREEPAFVVSEPDIVYAASRIEDNVVKMPVMDMQFAAGVSAYAPDFLETADFVFIPRTWLKKGGIYACGRIRGNSMAPTLLDSGYGLIRLLEPGEWSNMPDEEIYVVVSKENNTANVQVKRVKNRTDKGFIVMMSDNPDKASFPNFNIYNEEIVSIWHMDWYFTSRMPNIHNQYYSRLKDLEDKVDDLMQELKPVLKIK